MASIKNEHLLLSSSVVPAVFLAVSFFRHSPLWIIGTGLSLFAMVALLPFCRKRENLWMFIFVAVFGTPVNIFLVKEYTWYLAGDDSRVVTFFYGALLFFVLFSVEEIVFSLITRLIWRKQYKLFPKDFDEQY